jgi:hypothetical protein
MKDHFITAVIPRPLFYFSRVARTRVGAAGIPRAFYFQSSRFVSDSAPELLGNVIFARMGMGRCLPSTNLFIRDMPSRRTFGLHSH